MDLFKFFKKKNKYPSFRILTTFYKKDYYFLRNAEWTAVDTENTLVTDPLTLDVVTLNNWAHLVFRSADGQQTIEQYIYFIADQYPGDIPYTLDHMLISELIELEKKKLIVFTNKKQMLPKEFELPGLSGSK